MLAIISLFSRNVHSSLFIQRPVDVICYPSFFKTFFLMVTEEESLLRQTAKAIWNPFKPSPLPLIRYFHLF